MHQPTSAGSATTAASTAAAAAAVMQRHPAGWRNLHRSRRVRRLQLCRRECNGEFQL
jgi:mevalonate pyrophosphate decarboxylase